MTNDHDHKLARFRPWKQRLDRQIDPMKRADEWLFTNASAVLLSEKPGELLCFHPSNFDLTESLSMRFIGNRCKEWGVDFFRLHSNGSKVKLIIYSEERVTARLKMVPPCVLHGRLRYPREINAEAFLSELSMRWTHSGKIPHEIGFALGYQVEDVMGFMGMEPLECKGFCGWRVYGDIEEAKRLGRAFGAARCRALQVGGKDEDASSRPRTCEHTA
jgi:hypothetical protein